MNNRMHTYNIFSGKLEGSVFVIDLGARGKVLSNWESLWYEIAKLIFVAEHRFWRVVMNIHVPVRYIWVTTSIFMLSLSHLDFLTSLPITFIN